MRIIVHCHDPADMVCAMRCVEASIYEDREQCAYGFGEPENASVYVYRNKTGWTVRVERPVPPQEEAL